MKTLHRHLLAAALPLLSLLAACSSDAPGGSGPVTGDDAGAAADSSPPDSSFARDTGSSPPVDGGGTDSTTATDTGADTSPTDAAADAPAPTCGPPPARYTLLTGADDGLARDNVTGLVWMRDDHGAGEPPQTQSAAETYCTGRGMRLPTKDEALALAASYASCAFGMWGTWTSTAAAGNGLAWVVDYTGGASPQLADNFPSAVLCVRDPSGG